MPENVTPALPANVFEFLSEFRQAAFGLIVLIILWVWILNPVLDRQAIDHSENQKLMLTMQENSREMSNSIREVAESLRMSAMIFDRAATKITGSRAFIKVEDEEYLDE